MAAQETGMVRECQAHNRKKDYRLYHDESKRFGYWHGMLLVPESSRASLLSHLELARRNTNYQAPLAIKKIKDAKGPIYSCANSWILLAVGLMRTKLGSKPFGVHHGKRIKGKLKYEILTETLGLKFILFREKGDHQEMRAPCAYAAKVETTFRMGLKGGLNFLASPESPINIIGMHFDGNEHHKGGIDKTRVIGRLTGLRSFCSVRDADLIIDDRSSNHTRPSSQRYDDCQILQLTDLLVGSFRTQLGLCTRKVHKSVTAAACLPVSAFLRGRRGFLNSRWSGSFCMSQCELIGGQWSFAPLEITHEHDESQLSIDLFKDDDL